MEDFKSDYNRRRIRINNKLTLNLYRYFGDNRPMLVANCIYRVGAAAVLLSNDARRWHSKAKMELSQSPCPCAPTAVPTTQPTTRRSRWRTRTAT
ncbi:3-ketoacyl-CoA synthase 8 [Acorus calamus]|uniref:3-ketoacyl-CoA synthase 8 n=1 Tax=Acorus calamus TaxID=4465 RepID=A0AAV9E0J7_ACOCL|nr:3-ketoacyl-CoA synthase 8 [Acorus calamus]